MMTKERNEKAERMKKSQVPVDGRAVEVELVRVPKWVPVLQPVLPKSTTQDRTVRVWCPGCGFAWRTSSRGRIIAMLRSPKGLPICNCGHRFTTDYVDGKNQVVEAAEPVKVYAEPTKATQADDPQIEHLNRMKVLRERIHAVREVYEPSHPKVKKAEQDLKDYLESTE